MPFHFWAPDTYEGAPTPVTAFLSVASKAGGFVALLTIIYFGFYGTTASAPTRGGRALWVLAAASMTLGNLAALRQTNIVRMLAYSSIAQGGFMLVPFAAAGIAGADGNLERRRPRRSSAVVIYLLIYGAMNLGAFAVVIAVARRTRSAEISSYAGLFQTSPGPRGHDDDLHGVARRHPAARGLVRQVRDVPLDPRRRHRVGRRSLAVIAAVNSVIAFFYYFAVVRADVVPRARRPRTARAIRDPARARWRDRAHRRRSTVVIGIYPQLFARVGELAF